VSNPFHITFFFRLARIVKGFIYQALDALASLGKVNPTTTILRFKLQQRIGEDFVLLPKTDVYRIYATAVLAGSG
jgi:hypothetical protein